MAVRRNLMTSELQKLKDNTEKEPQRRGWEGRMAETLLEGC